MAPHYLAQPTSSMNTIQPELQKISKSTPIEYDEQHDSQTMLYGVARYQTMQADYLRVKIDNSKMMPSPHSNEHYTQHDISGLEVELTNKDNKIKDLTKQINELKQLLQQKQQRESDSEQIIECYQAQVKEILAQGEPRAAAERYEMKSKPHGIAVIINNFTFHSFDADGRLPTCAGSEIDEENLRVVWKYLGYEVRVHRNLTAAQLSHQLLEIAAEDHGNFDSFVCCILSHGDRDSIYGTDGQLLKISEFARLFGGTYYCPSLVSKPKLFFVEACHGDDKDQGIPLEEGDDGDGLRNSLPSEADFLLAYSTPLGHTSWRSPRYGSWYISTLCKVFMKNAYHHDLLSMLTMVNKELSEAHTTEGYRQCPAPVSLLRKQVWFLSNT